MRPRTRVATIVLATVITGALIVSLWLAPRPVEVKLVSVEPAGIIDDSGAQMRLVVLAVRNRDSVNIEFQRNRICEARIASRWAEVSQSFYLERLAPGTSSEVMLLLPAYANACRLPLKYQTEMFKWRIWRRVPEGLRGGITKSSRLTKWLWPKGDSMRKPPRWIESNVDVVLPPSVGQPRTAPR